MNSPPGDMRLHLVLAPLSSSGVRPGPVGPGKRQSCPLTAHLSPTRGVGGGRHVRTISPRPPWPWTWLSGGQRSWFGMRVGHLICPSRQRCRCDSFTLSIRGWLVISSRYSRCGEVRCVVPLEHPFIDTHSPAQGVRADKTVCEPTEPPPTSQRATTRRQQCCVRGP
jgi:hypothetical protein